MDIYSIASIKLGLQSTKKTFTLSFNPVFLMLLSVKSFEMLPNF